MNSDVNIVLDNNINKSIENFTDSEIYEEDFSVNDLDVEVEKEVFFYKFKELENKLYISIRSTDFTIKYPGTNRKIYDNLLLEVEIKDVVKNSDNGFLFVSEHSDKDHIEKIYRSVEKEENMGVKDSMKEEILNNGILMLTGEIIEMESTVHEFKIIKRTEILIKDFFFSDYSEYIVGNNIEEERELKEGFYNYIVSLQKGEILEKTRKTIYTIAEKGETISDNIRMLELRF